MDRDAARREIKSRWREIIATMTTPARSRVNGETSWICPLCEHGTHGDGLTFNPKSKDRNGLQCFGCGFKGDIIDLYERVNHCDHNTAFSLLAQDQGIEIDPYKSDGRQYDQSALELPENSTETARKEPAEETMQQEPLTDYTAYYKRCAARLDDPAAIDYLQSRGIRPETAAAYNLGYDPAWISPTALHNLKAAGNNWMPAPSARIIAPVTSNHYLARAIDPDAKIQKQNETGGGRAGIFNAEALQGDFKTLFVVEGVFDALSIKEAGAEAVALNSTSNADLFLEQLQQKPPKAALIICLDNDTAGKQAADKIIAGAGAINVTAITADITGEYKDANEALNGNRAAFVNRIRAAQQATEKVPGDVLGDFLTKVQTDAYKPYRTELAFFDDLLGGGVIQQSLLLLMAAPAAGKTTLCQQISEAMAAHGKPVIYLNFEMSREQMLAKAISARVTRKGLKKSATDILQGYSWTDQEREIITADIEDYRQKIFPFMKYNPDGMTADLDRVLDYLHRVGESYKERGKQAPAVVVDYLHLMSSKGMDIQELIKQAVTGLKNYAKDYDTFVIAILATNREANKTGRFTMESARDSSNLEYTGDYQLSLNYAALDSGEVSPTDTDGIAKLQREPWRQMILRVHKHRLGMPGRSANIYFHAASSTFYGEGEFMPADDTRAPWGQLHEDNMDISNLTLEPSKKKITKRL